MKARIWASIQEFWLQKAANSRLLGLGAVRYNGVMTKRYLRPILATVVLAITVVLFVRYFQTHPSYWHALGRVSPWTILWVILLNIVMLMVLTLLCEVTVRLCGTRLKWRENFMLTAYSSIANFFGPLQSGPGVRAVYLKTRHQIRLRDYTLASLLALGLFASFSALFLLIGTRPWWQTVVALVFVAGVSLAVVRWFQRRDTKPAQSHFRLSGNLVASLVILTFLQAATTVGWYYVELKAVDPAIHFSQALSYSGTANFSLFVSVTPDAVGIREAFLVFSQHIHHVSTADIVSANVIDRAAYVIFLVALFVVVTSLHAGSKLGLRKQRPPGVSADSQSPQ